MAMGSAGSAGLAKDWPKRASGEIFSSVGFLFAGIGASAPFIAGQPVDLCRYFIYRIFVPNTGARAEIGVTRHRQTVRFYTPNDQLARPRAAPQFECGSVNHCPMRYKNPRMRSARRTPMIA